MNFSKFNFSLSLLFTKQFCYFPLASLVFIYLKVNYKKVLYNLRNACLHFPQNTTRQVKNSFTYVWKVHFSYRKESHPYIRPLWPSGLICHVSNSSRDRLLGSRFESRSGTTCLCKLVRNSEQLLLKVYKIFSKLTVIQLNIQ